MLNWGSTSKAADLVWWPHEGCGWRLERSLRPSLDDPGPLGKRISKSSPRAAPNQPVGLRRRLHPPICGLREGSGQGEGSLPRRENKFHTLRNESEVFYVGVIQCRVNLKI